MHNTPDLFKKGEPSPLPASNATTRPSVEKATQPPSDQKTSFRSFPLRDRQQLPDPGSLQNARATTRWWTHVWSGLVRDPSGKHYHKMKQAIWLYLYLLLGANWRTGGLFRRMSTISKETGFKTRSIARWLATLRKNGYIELRSSGRSLLISIKNWRPISKKNRPP